MNQKGGGYLDNAPLITIKQFDEMINNRELDGVLIAADNSTDFTKSAIQFFKFHQVPKIGVIGVTYRPVIKKSSDIVYWLSPDKDFISYIETHIIDSCNLNCKSCGHFAPLFNDDEFYDIEDFRRDIRALSEKVDLIDIRLMGGEPFLKKDIADYIEITRHYMPKTNIRIATNALLIPSLAQSTLDSIRDNDAQIDISLYQPTMKVIDKVKNILDENHIVYNNSTLTERYANVIINFGKGLSRKATNDPNLALAKCGSKNCHLLRDGKLYKCPRDALIYKFADTFDIHDFPAPMGIDIHAENFTAMLRQLDTLPIEMCKTCGKGKSVKWEAPSKCVKEEWLID